MCVRMGKQSLPGKEEFSFTALWSRLSIVSDAGSILARMKAISYFLDSLFSRVRIRPVACALACPINCIRSGIFVMTVSNA